MDKEVALIVAAHCDDAELWAGGTIASYVNSGWNVNVAIANHSKVRRKEAIDGARILGSALLFKPINHSLQKWVSNVLQENKPTVLITHPANDPHKQHWQCYRATLDALLASKFRSRYPIRWYVFDNYYLTCPQAGCPILVDISNEVTSKIEALKAHESQEPEKLIDMALAMNRLHGMKIRVKYAEAFYPFSLLGRWPRLRDLP